MIVIFIKAIIFVTGVIVITRPGSLNVGRILS